MPKLTLKLVNLTLKSLREKAIIINESTGSSQEGAMWQFLDIRAGIMKNPKVKEVNFYKKNGEIFSILVTFEWAYHGRTSLRQFKIFVKDGVIVERWVA